MINHPIPYLLLPHRLQGSLSNDRSRSSGIRLGQETLEWAIFSRGCMQVHLTLVSAEVLVYMRELDG